MHPFVQTTLVLGVAATAVALVLGALELRRLRNFLATDKIKVMTFQAMGSPSMQMGLMTSPAGYAIHVFRQGHWVLETDLSSQGYEPVTPSIPGAYEGQVVKKQSALALSE